MITNVNYNFVPAVWRGNMGMAELRVDAFTIGTAKLVDHPANQHQALDLGKVYEAKDRRGDVIGYYKSRDKAGIEIVARAF